MVVTWRILLLLKKKAVLRTFGFGRLGREGRLLGKGVSLEDEGARELAGWVSKRSFVNNAFSQKRIEGGAFGLLLYIVKKDLSGLSVRIQVERLIVLLLFW